MKNESDEEEPIKQLIAFWANNFEKFREYQNLRNNQFFNKNNEMNKEILLIKEKIAEFEKRMK